MAAQRGFTMENNFDKKQSDKITYRIGIKKSFGNTFVVSNTFIKFRLFWFYEENLLRRMVKVERGRGNSGPG